MNSEPWSTRCWPSSKTPKKLIPTLQLRLLPVIRIQSQKLPKLQVLLPNLSKSHLSHKQLLLLINNLPLLPSTIVSQVHQEWLTSQWSVHRLLEAYKTLRPTNSSLLQKLSLLKSKTPKLNHRLSLPKLLLLIKEPKVVKKLLLRSQLAPLQHRKKWQSLQLPN